VARTRVWCKCVSSLCSNTVNAVHRRDRSPSVKARASCHFQRRRSLINFRKIAALWPTTPTANKQTNKPLASRSSRVVVIMMNLGMFYVCIAFLSLLLSYCKTCLKRQNLKSCTLLTDRLLSSETPLARLLVSCCCFFLVLSHSYFPYHYTMLFFAGVILFFPYQHCFACATSRSIRWASQ
jgi:hypothetical protein